MHMHNDTQSISRANLLFFCVFLCLPFSFAPHNALQQSIASVVAVVAAVAKDEDLVFTAVLLSCTTQYAYEMEFPIA